MKLEKMNNNLTILIAIIFLVFQLVECRRFFFNSKLPKKPIGNSKFSNFCNQVNYFPQIVDHFNFNPSYDEKYNQRYIYNDQFMNKDALSTPIFFYTGNEGDIVWFCENTGFVWEIAQKFGAVVVFAEHRYYGTSLPFGNKSFESPFIHFLTSEQALADYAYLIKYLKNKPELKSSPVIAFGGSYGGMLSAWFRMKYPNVVAGALAASAPIWQFVADCDSFLRVVTDAFKKADPNCPQIISSSWKLLNEYGKSKSGLKNLTRIFNLCDELEDVELLKDWLNEAYGDIAMSNYPYATNFLNPLPAWPVKEMCSNITEYFVLSERDPSSVLKAIYRGVNLYQNYTGNVKCFDVDSIEPADINMDAWNYQTCTEFVFPMCSNGKNDMFEPQAWDYNSYVQNCNKTLQVVPKAEWPIFYYGSSAEDLKAHSNIIFSNGDLDPWSSGGVTVDINSKIAVILIENGAHHLDLRASNKDDPSSVIVARLTEIDLIQKWIKEFGLKNL